MGQIKSVLFDLGNVLAVIDFYKFWSSLGFSRPEEIAPFADGYTSWTRQFETGFISTSEYLTGLHSVFGCRFTLDQLEQAFANIIQKPVDGMMDIVKRISREHRTALVSNTNEIHYKISLEKFEVLSVLHTHYLSYNLRVMKPAHGFYDAIISDQKIDPSEMLFIDDIADNINAAKNAGMQAVKFEKPGQLEDILKTFGVLL
jgi:putative hydrolase of the HAD superfamily